ncbi:MAG: hypothetical protein A2580_08710 [Hydrogenophilales bacterium RIFOXYD1_FULL_62_11]|nr:MAG: hypothetical protein A2580_08710 [Hydrogenophilales bacterium RIFOXYD1_FULL_62_11]
MWISQLSVYDLTLATPAMWPEQMQEHALTDPEAGLRKSVGFLLGPTDKFVESYENQHAFLAAQAERHLPKDAVEREVRKQFKAADLEDEGALKKAWAEVELKMLGTAPVREKRVPAVFDEPSGRLYVFGPPKLAEEVVLQCLRNATGSAHATPILPSKAVQPELTRWLAENALPAGFFLGNSADLEASEEEGGKASFKGRNLRCPEILNHLEQGDRILKLALNWGGGVEFQITHKGEIKSIGPPECKMKPQDAFIIWPDIMTQVPALFDSIMEALGGTRSIDSGVQVEERPPPPATIAVLASGTGADISNFHARMETLVSRRAIGEILVPAVPNDVQRSAVTFANQKGIRVTFLHGKADKESPSTAKLRIAQVLARKPNAIVVFGESEETTALAGAGQAAGITLMRLDAKRA